MTTFQSMGNGKLHLLIDRGNSYCKVATAFGGKISTVEVYKELTIDVLEGLIENERDRGINAIYSSVGPHDEKIIVTLVERADKFIFLDRNTNLPLSCVHYDRRRIGPDRLALAVGASYLYPGQSALVIDMGTAITYDLISQGAALLGGDITPGPKTRSRSLHNCTAHLPEVSLNDRKGGEEFGITTEEAIINGIFRGIVFEINGYIEYAKHLCPDCITLMTGGYTPYFANQIKYQTFVVPNLLMIGLNKILEYND